MPRVPKPGVLVVSALLGFLPAAGGGATFHRSFQHGFPRHPSEPRVPGPKPGSFYVCDGSVPVRPGVPFDGRVTRVLDGDTLRVTPDGNFTRRVRLARIDAPEAGQPFGAEAMKRLKQLVEGRMVRVEWSKKDADGHLLGVVHLPNARFSDEPPDSPGHDIDVNLLMVREGWAWHLPSQGRIASYSEAQNQARQAGRGLWAGEKPISPVLWRKGCR
ncbi:MAG: thermonuclease family protein [Kiritimatiellia bacterium]